MQSSKFLLVNAIIVIILVLWIFRSRSRPKPTQFDLGGIKRLDQNPNRPREKVLNCFFEFKGQRFDAFEVLGIPAGATSDLIAEGYRSILSKTQGAESKAKIQAAYEALQKAEPSG